MESDGELDAQFHFLQGKTENKIQGPLCGAGVLWGCRGPYRGPYRGIDMHKLVQGHFPKFGDFKKRSVCIPLKRERKRDREKEKEKEKERGPLTACSLPRWPQGPRRSQHLGTPLGLPQGWPKAWSQRLVPQGCTSQKLAGRWSSWAPIGTATQDANMEVVV